MVKFENELTHPHRKEYEHRFVCRLYSLDLVNIEVLWFSTGTPFSSTNKTDRHNITEILLKVALNTITPCKY